MKFKVGDVIDFKSGIYNTKKVIVDITNTKNGKRYSMKFYVRGHLSDVNLRYPTETIDSRYKKIGVNKKFIKRNSIKRLA